MKHSRVDFTGAIQTEESSNDIEKGTSSDEKAEVKEEEEYPELPYYPSSCKRKQDNNEYSSDDSVGIDLESLDNDLEEKMKKPASLGDTDLESSSKTDTDRDPTEKTIATAAPQTKAEVHVVTDLQPYEGISLGEKIDSLIAAHPVVMFNRTWCLFSVDAINFLVLQLNVPVHSIEIDVHPLGKEILKYISTKHNYHTTPFIFIQGEFLGGFSEVNALYAQGKLQEDYLVGLSQADRCEAFIQNGAYQMSTYFWFPEKVDANVVRLTGVLTFFASAVCAIMVHWEEFYWARYLAYAIALDFCLRLLGGARVSVFGRVAMLLALPMEPIPRMGKPKQFATCCGILFSGLGALFFLLPFPGHDIVGSAFMGGLAVATGMEGFLDFCVGCLFFRIGVNLGIFQGL